MKTHRYSVKGALNKRGLSVEQGIIIVHDIRLEKGSRGLKMDAAS